jgi:ADP-ribose pyrophosphatase
VAGHPHPAGGPVGVNRLTQGESQPMEDERIETRWFTKKEIRRLIASNEILDAKTMIGFLYWARL